MMHCIYLSLAAPETSKSVAQALLESMGSCTAICSTLMRSSGLCWDICAGSLEGEAGKAVRNLVVFSFKAHGEELQSLAFIG